MEECRQRMLKLLKEFQQCQKALTAIGDETRQHIIISLMESDCSGIRVGEITKKTHLSRPAVFHHLQILKEANIITMRREGTKNYYSMNTKGSEFENILKLMMNINEIIKDVSEKENLNCNEE